MCIIVAKNKGVELPTKKTLRQCFERNKDGAGIMYVKDNKVIIEKGLMTFQEFYQKLRSIKREFGGDLTNKAIVMHFRIGTHGENDKETTHPFPISSNFNDLRATYFETDIGMVHNGIISAYNYDSVLSDTQTFIRDYVSVFKDLKKNFYKNSKVMEIIADKANTMSNKLCFLDNKENIYWYGNKFIDNGVIYSNETYKPYTYNSYRNYNYNYNYDYDYWYGYSSYSNSYSSKSKNKVKSYTLDDFVKNRIKYELLEVGDYYETENGKDGDFVHKNEMIIIDKDHNLYEVKGNSVSLIGTDVDVFDSNFKIKYFTYKGGLAQ